MAEREEDQTPRNSKQSDDSQQRANVLFDSVVVLLSKLVNRAVDINTLEIETL